MKKTIYLVLLTSSLLFGMQRGDILSSSTLKALHIGKRGTYVIDFFASWCHSCSVEMPQLSKLHRSGRVKVIGVDIDQKPSDAKKFQSRMRKAHKLSFGVIDDPKGSIIKRFDPPGVPALYIIKNGKIIGVEIGAKSHIDKRILGYLK